MSLKEEIDESVLEQKNELEPLAEKEAQKIDTCIHEKMAVHPLKEKRKVKKVTGFDFSHIENLLANMESIGEQVKWLKNFLNQLQQTQRTMSANSWVYATANAIENQQHSMKPYIQTLSLAIRAVQSKLRHLKEIQKKMKYSRKK